MHFRKITPKAHAFDLKHMKLFKKYISTPTTRNPSIQEAVMEGKGVLLEKTNHMPNVLMQGHHARPQAGPLLMDMHAHPSR